MSSLNSLKGQPSLPLVTNIVSNQSTGDLKILSWNIYMLPVVSIFNRSADRARVIAEQLNKSDYQLIVFQEAFSLKIRRILKKQLSEVYPYQYGPINKNYTPFRTNSGLMIVSKLPLKLVDQIEFKNLKGFDAVARKGAALFEGSYNNIKFQLVTTHLQADKEHSIRETQCRAIKQNLLDKYFDKNQTQFICGDFNVNMFDTLSYQSILQTLQADNGDMVGETQVTYDEINNNLAKKESKQLKVIDYVLTRNTHLINKIERRVSCFLATVKGKNTNLSDHYAIEFVVNFQSQQEAAYENMWAFTN